jgi:hypothetical protein
MSAARKWFPSLIFAFAATYLVNVGHATPILNPEGPLQRNVCGAGGEALASTCLFTANAASDIPMSARTDFIEDWDSIGYDGLTLAEHELFHAIGFTVKYPVFDAKIYVTPGAGSGGIPAGSRVYSSDGTVGGILMVLGPASDGTHSDPNATGTAPWPATGYDQTDEIMQSTLAQGVIRSLNGWDAAVLDDAFGYGVTGLNIGVINLGNSMSQLDMGILNQAVHVTEDLFGPVDANSPIFTWTVAEASEPATFPLVMISLVLMWTVSRRRILLES